MRVVYVGTVEGSRVGLESLIRAQLPPALVVTLPSTRSGRHSDFADLSATARMADIDVHFTDNINAAETLDAIRAVSPDLCLVIGWSQLCRKEFLSIPRLGAVGFHPAALPRMRGRAVIPWTILIQEKETGSTLFWIDDGVDSGPILLQRKFPVSHTDTSKTLYEQHTRNLAEMLPEAISAVAAGRALRMVQDESKATYCAKRTPADGRIDWHEPAESILRLIRAVGPPYPGAITQYRDEELIIYEGEASDDGFMYIGVTGQVQAHRKNGFLVRCGDGRCIEVTAWRSRSGAIPKLHEKLGSV